MCSSHILASSDVYFTNLSSYGMPIYKVDTPQNKNHVNRNFDSIELGLLGHVSLRAHDFSMHVTY